MSEISINLARELQITYYLSTIYFVILYYDYLLTLPAEVRLFWFRSRRARWSWPSILFFLNRYAALLGHVPFIIEVFIFPANRTVCETINKFHQFYAALSQLLGIIICAIRVSAIYNHYRPVLAFLVLLILGCIVLGLWGILSGWQQGSPVMLGLDFNIPGCNPLHSPSQSARFAVAWSGPLVFDCAVFVLTATKAFRIGRQFPGSLVRVLLRDGTLYFILLFLANLSNILMYLYAVPVQKGTNTILVNVLSTVAISRLMLNLRATHERSMLGSSRTDESASTVLRMQDLSGRSRV
ncbi:hypothetical protein DENSPDRAFT_279792 [Dentipellis sp. KUC8613]|nr:hypothetical protein DENSPDRAFT_279792 [Dentipellis sp. KUC8613]